MASRRNPVATVAIDAGYGGLVGLLVGTGVTLVDDDDRERSLRVGTGIRLIVGAAVGVGHAAWEARTAERERGERISRAEDGLGSPARDPVIRDPPLASIRGRF